MSNLEWTAIAMSYTGKYQTAVNNNNNSTNGMFNSIDYGATWALNSNIPVAFYQWKGVAISETGEYQTAVRTGGGVGGVWRSSNYGVTWTSSETADYQSITMSASGQYQSIGKSTVRISFDYGATWQYPTTAPNYIVWSMDCSASGQYQTASPYQNSTFWTSSDYGMNWTKNTSPDVVNLAYAAITVSESGKYQVASSKANGGIAGIFTSSDYGKTWAIQPSTLLLTARTQGACWDV